MNRTIVYTAIVLLMAAQLTFAQAFSIFDDDTMDKFIPSSGASTNPNWIGGYASIYFPLLHSADIRGCLSAEGQRIGFTESEPTLNENGLIVKKMQEDYDWEVSCHTMTARYVRLNYEVESLNSDLARQILRESTNWQDYTSMSTTMVYDHSTASNYYATKDQTQWLPVPREYIRPYLMDYATQKATRYNPTFPVEYQWGRFLELADSLGLSIETGVYPANTGSHAICPQVATILPWTFDVTIGISRVNTPPLTTCANRYQLDIAGETNTDNAYHAEELAQWKAQIDEAKRDKGWIVFFMHSYRPCWSNRIDSALFSRGGTYPDEWVHPILDTDNIVEALDTPPARLGIQSWSEWHPCPGSRLAMVHELFSYARSQGIPNLLAREGFAQYGNILSEGMYTKGGQTGQDMYDIEGTEDEYPCHIIGADGTEIILPSPTDTMLYEKTSHTHIYTIDGRQLQNITRGLQVIRHGDGHTQKIFVP